MTDPAATSGHGEALPHALDARWAEAAPSDAVRLRIGVAVALSVHLLLATAITGGFDGVLGALGLPTAAPRPPPIGDKSGAIDGVSAEVIDAAEFNKRYVAFKAGRGEVDSEAAPRQPPPQDAAPQPADAPTPSEQPVAELKPGDGWAPSAHTAALPEPEPRPKEKPPEQRPQEKQAEPRKPAPQPALTDAEVRELLAQSMDDVQSSLVSVSAPGAAKLGEASPFVKSVIRTLKSNMPRPRGMTGNVVIQLVVGATGEIEGIRVVRSSGRPELDRLVMERVYKTRLAAPPPTASLRERLFQITYSYN